MHYTPKEVSFGNFISIMALKYTTRQERSHFPIQSPSWHSNALHAKRGLIWQFYLHHGTQIHYTPREVSFSNSISIMALKCTTRQKRSHLPIQSPSWHSNTLHAKRSLICQFNPHHGTQIHFTPKEVSFAKL